MKPKILFTSGLIMSAVAVALLVASGFNFQDLKPANWKNLRTAFAASGNYYEDSNFQITKPRLAKVSCYTDAFVYQWDVFIYLGPEEYKKTVTLYNDSTKTQILSRWDETYTASSWKKANGSIGNTFTDVATTIPANWQSMTTTFIPGTRGNNSINLFDGRRTWCNRLDPSNPTSSHKIFTSGLYGWAENGIGAQGAGSSIPLSWKVSGTFTQ